MRTDLAALVAPEMHANEIQQTLFISGKKSKENDDSQAKELELFQQIGRLQIADGTGMPQNKSR